MEQAIGYVGVSTEEQSKEGVSLVAQQELIRAYASMRGLELIHIYVHISEKAARKASDELARG